MVVVVVCGFVTLCEMAVLGFIFEMVSMMVAMDEH
jgi:hypothetical protein